MRKANYQICVTLLGTGLLGGLVVATAATANAEVVKLQADLKGSNEVPPNRSNFTLWLLPQLSFSHRRPGHAP